MPLPSNFLGDLIASTQGGSVEPPQQNNIIAQLLGGNNPLPTAGGMTAQQAGPAPVVNAAPSGRPRRSVLDMIGGLADTIATVGGAAPLYRQNLDAQQNREWAQEDRTREIDLEGLKKKLLENQIAAGGQNLEAGDLEIQGARNELLNSAGMGLRQVFGQSGTEGLAKAWPLVAQQLGIPDEQAAQIGEALGADAEGTLTALFPAPVQQGSTAKEAQVFALLKSQGTPEMAQAYLQSITNPDAITPYQQAQLDLAQQKFGFERQKYANPAPTAAQRTAATKQAAADEEKAAGAANVNATLDELSGVYDQLDSMNAMVNAKKGTGTNIQAYLRSTGPGQIAEGMVGTEAQQLRDRVKSIRPQLMQQLAQATGMSSKQLDSNSDVKLFMQTVTDPNASYEANQQAIAGLRRLLASPPPRREQAPAGNRRAPAPRQKGTPAPRRDQAIKLKSAADYAKVPKGATFITPDGRLMRKK